MPWFRRHKCILPEVKNFGCSGPRGHPTSQTCQSSPVMKLLGMSGGISIFFALKSWKNLIDVLRPFEILRGCSNYSGVPELSGGSDHRLRSSGLHQLDWSHVSQAAADSSSSSSSATLRRSQHQDLYRRAASKL